MKVKSQMNLGLIQPKNFTIECLSEHPIIPEEKNQEYIGYMHYNISTDSLDIYTGTDWLCLHQGDIVTNWSSEVQYMGDEFVFYANDIYVCIKSNKNVPPVGDPTSSKYWQEMSFATNSEVQTILDKVFGTSWRK